MTGVLVSASAHRKAFADARRVERVAGSGFKSWWSGVRRGLKSWWAGVRRGAVVTGVAVGWRAGSRLPALLQGGVVASRPYSRPPALLQRHRGSNAPSSRSRRPDIAPQTPC